MTVEIQTFLVNNTVHFLASEAWITFTLSTYTLKDCESETFEFIFALILLPPANEVWGKVIFLHLSVILFTGECYPSMHCRWYASMPCRGSAIPVCIAGGIPACLAGGCYPSMHCRWYPSMPCKGESAPAGGLLPGGLLLGGVWWRPPGRLLLQAVRILLECILVDNVPK